VVVVNTLEVWLVRHGETDWSTAGRFCGWSDPPLNDGGRAQARALRAILEGERFDSVVSSPSIRAVETARLAYGEPVTDERLRELDFGDLEGSTWAECPDDVRAQLADYETFAAPRGESVGALTARIADALRALGTGKHLVVTHGGVILGLLRRAGVEGYPQPASLHRMEVSLAGDGIAARTL
jgi:probable phosphoglycerate mutase